MNAKEMQNRFKIIVGNLTYLKNYENIENEATFISVCKWSKELAQFIQEVKEEYDL